MSQRYAYPPSNQYGGPPPTTTNARPGPPYGGPPTNEMNAMSMGGAPRGPPGPQYPQYGGAPRGGPPAPGGGYGGPPPPSGPSYGGPPPPSGGGPSYGGPPPPSSGYPSGPSYGAPPSNTAPSYPGYNTRPPTNVGPPPPSYSTGPPPSYSTGPPPSYSTGPPPPSYSTGPPTMPPPSNSAPSYPGYNTRPPVQSNMGPPSSTAPSYPGYGAPPPLSNNAPSNTAPSYPGYNTRPPVSNMGPPPSGGSGFSNAPPPPPMMSSASTAPPSYGLSSNDGGRTYSGGPSAPAPQPLVAIDDSLQADTHFIRTTVGAVPSTTHLRTQTGITLGAMIRPLAEPSGDGITPVINFGTCGVVRCKRCRTYINPFVDFTDNGRRWKCNICSMLNDVQSQYFSHLESNGKRADISSRPELLKGQCEFVAPAEYMVRPPQAPVYFFVIDVSFPSVASGMLNVLVDTIRNNLDKLAQGSTSRTQVGFITYDSSVHFYNLKGSLKTPQMLVVSELDDLFLPLPDDLLVNLADSRKVVDTFLDSLSTMFASTRDVDTCFGPAIQAAFKAMGNIGGKMMIFQSSLPSLGAGALRHRENPKVLGTAEEKTLLTAMDAEGFYSKCAADFSRAQVAVDLHLFGAQYSDVATLSYLSKNTGGEFYYYPAFNANFDGVKFRSELSHNLTRQTAWEAVMRIRVSQGLKITKFYGNFFIRGSDLLAVPNCTSDSVMGFEFVHEDPPVNIGTVAYIQGALLYTTSSGERRIRVQTVAIPVTTSAADVFNSVDIDTLCNLNAKKVIEDLPKIGIDEARRVLQQNCVDILRAHRNSNMGGYGSRPGQQQVPLPTSLQLLPLYTMALQKNIVFRGGNDIISDFRNYHIQQLFNMSVDRSKVFLYPRMFALHTMSEKAGLPLKSGEAEVEGEMYEGEDQIRMPSLVNLSAENLTSKGAFLVEDGICMMLWIGREVAPNFLSSLFGVTSLDGIDLNMLTLELLDNSLSKRMASIINAIRDPSQRSVYQRLYIIRQGDPSPLEVRFHRYLVEDRATFHGGAVTYAEYLNQVNNISLGMGGGGMSTPGMGGAGGPPMSR